MLPVPHRRKINGTLTLYSSAVFLLVLLPALLLLLVPTYSSSSVSFLSISLLPYSFFFFFFAHFSPHSRFTSVSLFFLFYSSNVTNPPRSIYLHNFFPRCPYFFPVDSSLCCQLVFKSMNTIHLFFFLCVFFFYVTQQLLKHHVVPGAVQSSALQNNGVMQSLLKTPLRVKFYESEDNEWRPLKVRGEKTKKKQKKISCLLCISFLGRFAVTSCKAVSMGSALVGWMSDIPFAGISDARLALLLLYNLYRTFPPI